MNLKDFLSLANLAFGVTAVFLSFSGAINFVQAFVLLCFSVLFDYLDGKVARKTGSDEFGKQIDSLSDLASFGVCAPLTAAWFYPSQFLLTALGVVFFASAGAIRLARFNLQEEKGVFFGLPIPAAAILLLLTVPFLSGYSFIAFLVLGLLMVSKFRISKVL